LLRKTSTFNTIMAPKPVASNAQVQRLTTTLKQLCLDYPAGGGLLRELLQNADDAGAKEVVCRLYLSLSFLDRNSRVQRFFLDEGQYAVTGLIHEEALGQYQGPALLAFNSGVFKDGDFESLANLGDSAKFSDGSKTGKFGRGFNTVNTPPRQFSCSQTLIEWVGVQLDGLAFDRFSRSVYDIRSTPKVVYWGPALQLC
jgi:hypothetical protein